MSAPGILNGGDATDDAVAKALADAKSAAEAKGKANVQFWLGTFISIFVILVLYLIASRLALHMDNPYARILGMEDGSAAKATGDTTPADSATPAGSTGSATPADEVRNRRADEMIRAEQQASLLAAVGSDDTIDHNQMMVDLVVDEEQRQSHRDWATGQSMFVGNVAAKYSVRDDRITATPWTGNRVPVAIAATDTNSTSRVVNSDMHTDRNAGYRVDYNVGGNVTNYFGADEYEARTGNTTHM